MCLQSGLSSATSPWCGLKVTLQGERKCHDGDLARRHRHSQGHIPGLSPHAPLAHWPGSHTGPLIAPLPVSPRAAGHPWCPFPWFPMCSSSCVLGEQCGCPCSLCMTTGPVSPDSSHVCLPQLPAAAALPACFQLSADDSRDCSTVMSNPGLPAVGVPMGYVARLLEQPDRQLWCALCPMCPMCSMCSMCASVCHGVPYEPLHLQLPITCPLYPPAIAHPRLHYPLQNSPVTPLLRFIAHPLHTCYTPINL